MSNIQFPKGETNPHDSFIRNCLPVPQTGKLVIRNSRASFTLIELLVVLAIVAILSVVVILTLNPAELIKQARDSNRLSDLSNLNSALGLFNTDVNAGFMGTSSIVYVSIADTTSTCANLGLPTLPSGWTYNCVTATSTKNIDGTGWVPVNFKLISFGNPISNLPIDPINTTTTGNYYTYVVGGSWQISSKLESQKYQPKAISTNDYDPGLYVVGSNANLAPFVGGLVGWWKFDDNNNSTTSDSSGYGNTGTWNGTSSVRYVAGKVGSYAGSFNGSSDFVSVANDASINNTSNVTILAWANPSSLSGSCNNSIAIKGSSGVAFAYGMSLQSNAICSWYNGGTPASPTNTNSTGIWQFFGVTQTNSIAQYFYNGSYIGQASASGMRGSTQPLRIGSNAVSSVASWFFNGSLDEVRIYNRVLSVAEITALYNATR